MHRASAERSAGVLDGLACLAGFAVLGPYLGLWHTPAR
jgi:hypothetical protein